jgi:hypothetical protein
MDRLLMPKASELTLRPVCIQIEEDVGVRQMDQDEARQIMAEIDAKSSALLAVLAILSPPRRSSSRSSSRTSRSR